MFSSNSDDGIVENDVLLCLFRRIYHGEDRLGEEDISPLLKWICRFSRSNQGILSEKVLGRIEASDQLRKIRFFPGYGAVVVPNYDEYQEAAKFTVLALDGWKFHAEIKPDARNYSFSELQGSCSEYSVKFWECFQNVLNQKEEQERKKTERKKIGYQKTPSFIHCLLKRAVYVMENMDDELPADWGKVENGNMYAINGFTDVGKHTGIEPRDTVWPLIRCLLEYLHRQYHESDDWMEVLAQIKFYHAQELVKSCKNEKITQKLINTCMRCIRSCGATIDDLVENSTRKMEYSSLLVGCWKNLQSNIDLEAENVSKTFQLPILEPTNIFRESEKFVIKPSNDNFEIREMTASELEKAILVNLEGVDLNEFRRVGFPSDCPVSLKRVVLESVERYYFQPFERILSETKFSVSSAIDEFKFYQELAIKVQTEETDPIEKLLIKSNLTLMQFVLFCLLHQKAISEEKYLKEFKLPLDPALLQVLYLRKKISLETQVRIVAYLELFFDKNNCLLKDQRATIKLAEKCLEIEKYRRKVKDELRECRKLERKERTYRQDHIEKYKDDIERFEKKLQDLENSCPSSNDYIGYRNNQSQQKKFRRRILEWEDKVFQAISFDIPKDDAPAKIVLMFRNFPTIFKQVFDFITICLSSFFEGSQIKSLPDDYEEWVSLTQVDFTKFGGLKLYRTSKFKPKKSEVVVNVSSYLEDHEIGLNWPYFSELGSKFNTSTDIWCKSTSDCLQHCYNVNYHPGRPSEVSQIIEQYIQCMPFELTDEARENFGLAHQSLKNDIFRDGSFISFPGFRQFANFRAYPKIQIHQLIKELTLRDLSLPFQHQYVHWLIKSFLYQTGPIKEGHHEWRSLLRNKNIEESLYYNLCRHAEEISPMKNIQIPLFSALANYFSEQKDIKEKLRFRSVSTMLSDAALGFAKLTEDEIDRCTDEKMKLELIKKKMRNYSYSILCHQTGELNPENIKGLLKSLFSWKHAQQGLNFDEKDKLLIAEVRYAIGRRVHETCKLINDDILTEALNHLASTGESKLSWILHDSLQYCYTAKDKKYAINVLNGIVLIDGTPPYDLPKSVTRHPEFKRIFGDRSFFISKNMNSFEAKKLLNDRYRYTFIQMENRLKITEKDEKDFTNDHPVLELLPHGEITEWGNELPISLKELYSHWISRERQLILFRDKGYQDRKVHYIYDLDTKSIYIVPLERKSSHWIDLAKDCYGFDEIIRVTGAAVAFQRVLEKFEDQDYIEWIKVSTSKVRIHFRRFRLSFVCEGNGKFTSEQFSGFTLSPQQQLKDTLVFFKQYLCIESDLKKQIVVPKGVVSSCGVSLSKHPVSILTATGCDQKLSFSLYSFHDRFTRFSASSVLPKLQLATLYVCNSSLIAEKWEKRTGNAIGLYLIRRCWSDRPSDDFFLALKAFVECCRKYCAFPAGLIALELMNSLTRRIKYFEKGQKKDLQLLDALDDLVKEMKKLQFEHFTHFKNCYRSSVDLNLLDPFERLTEQEEVEIFGESFKLFHGSKKLPEHFGGVETKNFASAVKKCESVKELVQGSIQGLIVEKSTETKLKNGYFDETKERCKFIIGKALCDALEESWEEYRKSKSLTLTNGFNNDFLSKLLENTKQERSNLEDCFEEAFRLPNLLLHITNHFPIFVPQNDILRIIASKDHILDYLPNVSEENQQIIQDAAFAWGEMCTLEDLLQRFLLYVEKPEMILREVKRRDYNIREHPEWLVFEIENQITIRSIQIEVANHLITKEKTLTQLNVGEGKTKVIIPLLILHYLCKSERLQGCILRIFFLRALLSEAYDHLHSTLCDSLYNIRLQTFPFSREQLIGDDKLSAVKSMIGTLQQCQTRNSVLLLAPEHSLSLKLKELEWNMKDSPADGFLKRLKEINSFRFHDILDESDEILRSKYRLVYALGAQKTLPDFEVRIKVVQNLLETMQKNLDVIFCPEGEKYTKRVSLSKDLPGYIDSSRFQGFRIVHAKGFEEFWSKVTSKLAKDMVSLQETDSFFHPLSSLEGSLDFLTKDVKFPQNDHPEKLERLLLAICGFLRHEILEHCFSKSHRRNYGTSCKRSTRLVVPFNATESPTERSSFSHPDIVIVLTFLSYLYQGISENEAYEVIENLKNQGPSVQDKEYESWIKLFDTALMDEEERKEFDRIKSINQLDLSNRLQMKTFHQYFQFNRKLIYFFVRELILPELVEFPHAIEGNAWHLTDEIETVGFSGTDDGQLLLPRNVKQEPVNNDQTRGTNGKMIELLQRSRETNSMHDGRMAKCTVSLYNQPKEQAEWMRVIEMIHETNKRDSVDALIDGAGVMCGSTPTMVAEYLLREYSESILKTKEGVLYFDLNKDRWVVLLKNGLCVSLQDSHVKEHECFVFFDEKRCRGSDIKLTKDATAVLCIDIGMTKDVLIQSAGRMRQLDRDQSLIVYRSEKTAENIQESLGIEKEAIDARALTQWTILNTEKMIADNMPEFIEQTDYYFREECDRKKEIKTSLSDIYGERESGLLSAFEKYQQVLDKHDCLHDLKRFMKDVLCKSVDVNEESERELEKEIEQVQEEERWIEEANPRKSCGYLYSLMTLSDTLSELSIRKKVSKVQFSKIICTTENFRLATTQFRRDYDHYLREALFYVRKDENVVFISPREAEQMIQSDHFNYILQTIAVNPDLNPMEMCSIRFFNGETNYSDKEKQYLPTLLNKASTAHEVLPFLRHRSHYLEGSDLLEAAQRLTMDL